jgi:hypothetical protein
LRKLLTDELVSKVGVRAKLGVNAVAADETKTAGQVASTATATGYSHLIPMPASDSAECCGEVKQPSSATAAADCTVVSAKRSNVMTSNSSGIPTPLGSVEIESVSGVSLSAESLNAVAPARKTENGSVSESSASLNITRTNSAGLRKECDMTSPVLKTDGSGGVHSVLKSKGGVNANSGSKAEDGPNVGLSSESLKFLAESKGARPKTGPWISATSASSKSSAVDSESADRQKPSATVLEETNSVGLKDSGAAVETQLGEMPNTTELSSASALSASSALPSTPLGDSPVRSPSLRGSSLSRDRILQSMYTKKYSGSSYAASDIEMSPKTSTAVRVRDYSSDCGSVSVSSRKKKMKEKLKSKLTQFDPDAMREPDNLPQANGDNRSVFFILNATLFLKITQAETCHTQAIISHIYFQIFWV